MDNVAIYIIIGLALVVFFLIFQLKYVSKTGSRASKARNKKAQVGQDEAIRLLEKHGFEILDLQATAQGSFEVDGEIITFEVRADLLVERDGLLYVAEVKTGSVAPNPRHAATRRQLLEYYLIFQPDGILLVDMEAQILHEINFPELGENL